MTNIFTKFLSALRSLVSVDRNVSITSIWQSIEQQISILPDYAWLVNLYLDDRGAMFAAVAMGGKLYRASVINAVLVAKTAWEEVFDVGKNKFSITRGISGEVRWFLLAATSVLNRNGQIDSSGLFDEFVRQGVEEAKYPYLTFMHLGESFVMGKADWLSRDGVAFLASGLFNDTKLANRMILSYTNNPNYWGASIGFHARDAKQEEIAQGITIPVYEGNGSWCEEISVLPEELACSLLTALRTTKEVNRMNKKVEEALRVLAGDEETAKEFIAMVDEVNRNVEESGMIHRTTEEIPGPRTQADLTQSTVEQSSVEQAEIPQAEVDQNDLSSVLSGTITTPTYREMELDDTFITALTAAVMKSSVITTLQNTVSDITSRMQLEIDSLQKQLADAHSSQMRVAKEMEVKISDLQKDESAKQREWENDLSARAVNKTRITYRPRAVESSEQSAEHLSDVAAATLSNIK
jgi:hypothetical protein